MGLLKGASPRDTSGGRDEYLPTSICRVMRLARNGQKGYVSFEKGVESLHVAVQGRLSDSMLNKTEGRTYGKYLERKDGPAASNLIQRGGVR